MEARRITQLRCEFLIRVDVGDGDLPAPFHKLLDEPHAHTRIAARHNGYSCCGRHILQIEETSLWIEKSSGTVSRRRVAGTGVKLILTADLSADSISRPEKINCCQT
jgi:hypothetical protein